MHITPLNQSESFKTKFITARHLEGLNRVKKINRQPSKKVNYDRKRHELLGSEGSFETFQDPKTCLYMKIFRNFTC